MTTITRSNRTPRRSYTFLQLLAVSLIIIVILGILGFNVGFTIGSLATWFGGLPF